MTPDDHKRLRELAEDATRGPWKSAIVLLACDLAYARRRRNVRAAQEAESHPVRLAVLVSPADRVELEQVFAETEGATL